ncbi:MAG: helix-turn-helix domain-containing protein [Ruminiclostridium sp.]|nr:helix-turn-helix domain-containing protein [Ruminiclostridium sp.]
MSASRVYRLLNTGELNGFHCNRAWRIRKSDLIRYVESNCEHNK